MTILQTERLRLRPATAEDLQEFYEILSTPEAMTFWSTPPHHDLAQSEAWLSSMIETRPDQGEDFVVEYNGKVIGKAGFFRFPEIGFIFHPDYWKRGFAREALSVVIERAFSVHGLPRLTADVDPRNTACIGLLTRYGFVETGREERTWRVGEQWCDSVYFALDRETSPEA